MAFKMKNPSMAKLTKAAGDNRVAMKMKMEEKAAAKMKRESAMKMEKESMAKLMEKSAMKMKSPIKADIPEVEVTATKTKTKTGLTNNEKRKAARDEYNRLIKIGTDESLRKAHRLEVENKHGFFTQLKAQGTKSVKFRQGTQTNREGGTATKMKKSAMKLSKEDKKEIDRKEREGRIPGRGRGLNKPLDPKIPKKVDSVKPRKPGESATKFNKGLRAASAAGKLDNNPKFKAAVDAAPTKLMGKDRSKTKTKKSGKSKTVTIKDGKRSVVKQDAQGNVTKTKSGGVITKPQKGKTTTRKSQVKRGVKGVARGVRTAAVLGAAPAAAMYAPGFIAPIGKAAMGAVATSLGRDALNEAKRGEDKLRNRLKRKKKK